MQLVCPRQLVLFELENLKFAPICIEIRCILEDIFVADAVRHGDQQKECFLMERGGREKGANSQGARNAAGFRKQELKWCPPRTHWHEESLKYIYGINAQSTLLQVAKSQSTLSIDYPHKTHPKIFTDIFTNLRNLIRIAPTSATPVPIPVPMCVK